MIDVAVIDHDGVSAPGRHDKPFNYQVKKGDTLESIAEAHYGDKSYVTDIIALNPGIDKDKSPKIGAIINMPATRK